MYLVGMCLLPVGSEALSIMTYRASDLSYVMLCQVVARMHTQRMLLPCHPWVLDRYVAGHTPIGPPEFRTTHLLHDGTQVNYRPIHPTDEPNVRELFYALSQETIYYRFMTHMKSIPRREIQNFVYINHRSDIAIVGTVPEAHGEEIVAIGRYYLNEKTNLAEVAFVVRDAWQNRSIGTFLLNHLATIAKRYGIRGFTAEVLRANKPMQKIFTKSNYKVTSTPQEDVISFLIEF